MERAASKSTPIARETIGGKSSTSDASSEVIAKSLYPIMLVMAFVVFYVSFAALGYVLGIGVGLTITMLGVWLAEWRWPLRSDWTKLDDRQLVNDLTYNGLTGPVRTFFQHNVAIFIVTPLAIYAGELGYETNVWPHHWPWAAQIFLCLFVVDGLLYVLHRWCHKVSWLWSIHALHHSSDRLNMLKGSRFHLLEIGLIAVFVAGPVMLLGAPWEIILWHATAGIVIGTPAHANVRFKIPRFMYYVVMTQHVHALHHSSDPAIRNSNYALFPIWDLLFGTFIHPDRCVISDVDVGIRNNPVPAGLFGQLMAPLNWSSLVEKNRSRDVV